MNVWQWVDKWIRIDATGTTEWKDDYVNGIIILLNDSLYFCFHSKVEAKEQATKTIRHYVFLFKLKKKERLTWCKQSQFEWSFVEFHTFYRLSTVCCASLLSFARRFCAAFATSHCHVKDKYLFLIWLTFIIWKFWTQVLHFCLYRSLLVLSHYSLQHHTNLLNTSTEPSSIKTQLHPRNLSGIVLDQNQQFDEITIFINKKT